MSSPASPPQHDTGYPTPPELITDLAGTIRGEVRFDAGSRATYSTDASNYRQVPIGVVLPASIEDAVSALEICRRHDVAVLARGGGTSLAGQCCNTAVVLDFSKYCTGLLSVDAERKTAIVEPGITLDELNRQLRPYGLLVGPKPSTHASCTIGGMVGNNACGSTAQAYGKMVDSVLRMEIITYEGVRTWVGPTSSADFERALAEGGSLAEIMRGTREVRDEHLAEIRTRYPDIPRRVSGYNLDSLLPEGQFDLAKALVGSENTLATVLGVELQLFDLPEHRALVVLGYSDIFAAADAVPKIADYRPHALEGLDDRLVRLESIERLAQRAINELPAGSGWLMVQFAGDDEHAVRGHAKNMADELDAAGDGPSVAFLTDPRHEDELWKAREAGLGATAFPPLGGPTHEGWEDAAVPPERLGDYLRDFSELLLRFDYQDSSLYGHFGHGCVHTRIPFDLSSAGGVADYREFVERSAELVVSYGGSLSGEHGDGQSRGELLPKMFGSEITKAFEELKAVFDPGNRMNPGKVVHPNPLDSKLRKGAAYRPIEPATHFDYPNDDHRFSKAAARCVGIGHCRGLEGGVMCPSYRATREEEHSTRGRARLLYEMLNGDEIDGWRSTEVRDALDLCLACKGCKSDCPVDVDMATYKAEFLSHHYAGRLRPMAHYSMGWLPLLALGASVAPRAVNALAHTPGLAALVKRAGAVTPERELPRFAPNRFTSSFEAAEPAGVEGEVVLWPDTFTNSFHPHIARAGAEVLADAGFSVAVPQRPVCCGLTWISTGQLKTAKRILRRTLDVLRPALRADTPIVVLEPSCAAVFRSDLPELMHGDEDAHRLSAQTSTLAELLRDRAPDWHTPAIGRSALVQPHCHQHAIIGSSADTELMSRCGIDAGTLDAGCCGLAGNFGFERGHYEVSMACAEDKLMPALRDAPESTMILADGFSCRTQIEHAGGGGTPVHLAEVLAAALRQVTSETHPQGAGGGGR